MNLLILAENLEINRTSSGIRSHKQVLAYCQLYKNIDVLTTTPSHLLHKIGDVNYHFIEHNSNTQDHWINKLPKAIAIQNYLFGLDYLNFKLIKTWESKTGDLFKINDYNLVITLGTGASFIAAYALYFLKNKYNFKHLLFVHDPFPLNYYPPPYQKKNGLAYKSVARLFGKVLNRADLFSFPSQRLKEWMSEYYPIIKDKFIVQPHIGINLNRLKQHLPKQGTDIPCFPTGLNIVHTGTLLGPRNPFYLIKALEKLFIEIPEAKKYIHLHIMGKVNTVLNIEELCSKNVHVYPKRYTYLESLEIQQRADVLLILEAVSDVSPFMPGKLADYLMANKPILALTPKTSETTRILGKDYPLSVENGNIDNIAKKLSLIFKNYNLKTLAELNPPKNAIDHVSVENWINLTKEAI